MKIQNGRTRFYQWDLNQKLIVEDVKHKYAHFVLDDDPCDALVVKIHEEDGQRLADVPNVLLQRSGRLLVFLCSSDDTEAHTRERHEFTIAPRPKPSDYVYTPTEVFDYRNKLDNNFGSDNAGKILGIDEAGDVVPVHTGSLARLSSIQLSASKWVDTGDGITFKQQVDIEDITVNSKIDLQPTPEQLSQLYTAEISLTTINDGGDVTVYAIGAAPTSDYIMQVIISEVLAV